MTKIERWFFIFCCVLVAGFSLWIGQAVWRLKILAQAVKQAKSGRVLGVQVNARGPIAEPVPMPANLPKLNESDLKDIKAQSYIVFDLESGQVLAKKNSDQPLPIASLTKLMTALLVYERLDMDNFATVSPKSYWQVAPSLGLKSGDDFKIQNLFDAMLVGSANDAAFALADVFEKQTGEDFIKAMNDRAELLGMQDTSYSNPTGFDSTYNFSTADDLQKLITAVFKLSAFKNLSRRQTYEFKSQSGKSYKIEATNKLLEKYQDLLAVKTGYTKNALGAMATVVETKGRESAVLVLDTPQRETDTLLIRQAILNSINQ